MSRHKAHVGDLGHPPLMKAMTLANVAAVSPGTASPAVVSARSAAWSFFLVGVESGDRELVDRVGEQGGRRGVPRLERFEIRRAPQLFRRFADEVIDV